MPRRKKQDIGEACAAKEILHTVFKHPGSHDASVDNVVQKDSARVLFDKSPPSTPHHQPPFVDDAILDSNYQPSWVDLLTNAQKSKGKSNSGIPLQQMEKCNGRLKLPSEAVYDIDKECGYCLIGFFLSRFPGKEALIRTCDKWKVPYVFRSHQNGWLVFKFDNEEDHNYVLHGGPFVYGRPLLLKIMPAFFNFDSAKLKKLPVWVNLPGLPLACWKPLSLSFIASQIGRPIQTDDLTNKEYSSVSYARVLVEVDTSLPLILSIPLTSPDGFDFDQVVFYEHEPKNCSICSGVGHTEATCRYASGSNGVAPRRVPPPKWSKKIAPSGKKVANVLAKADGISSQPLRNDFGEGSSFSKNDNIEAPPHTITSVTVGTEKIVSTKDVGKNIPSSGAYEILNHLSEDGLHSLEFLYQADQVVTTTTDCLDPSGVNMPSNSIVSQPSPQALDQGKDSRGNSVLVEKIVDSVVIGKISKNKKILGANAPPPPSV